ncbi:unnamed protein product [Moneuplotes crassus]|uniref:Uncharacterized protein n=1 Tax=Euplotes crassus TaxID=5936 RepID=A0AAD1U6V9_EUPCR|nr:unnamed protein product [Moneuplotes crassus]
MSVYNGFSTRHKESTYNKAAYNMLFLLQHMVFKALTTGEFRNKESQGDIISEKKFAKHFEKYYTKMVSLEKHKYHPPKYSMALKDLSKYFCLDGSSTILIKGGPQEAYPRNQTPINQIDTRNKDLYPDDNMEVIRRQIAQKLDSKKILSEITKNYHNSFRRKYNYSSNSDSSSIGLKDKLLENNCKIRRINTKNISCNLKRSTTGEITSDLKMEACPVPSALVSDITIPKKMIPFGEKTSISTKEIKIKRKKSRVLAKSICGGKQRRFSNNFILCAADGEKGLTNMDEERLTTVSHQKLGDSTGGNSRIGEFILAYNHQTSSSQISHLHHGTTKSIGEASNSTGRASRADTAIPRKRKQFQKCEGIKKRLQSAKEDDKENQNSRNSKKKGRYKHSVSQSGDFYGNNKEKSKRRKRKDGCIQNLSVYV